ncbi:BAG domain containing protein [Gracilaria domingensis]|nr:BAG domain containing protein [Gracilaria domingensis]
MVDAADKTIVELRARVADLEQQVASLSPRDSDEQVDTEPSSSCPLPSQTALVIAESVTQALLQLDNVHISKDAAAQALRSGDRQTSRRISVLLARRKTLVRKLNHLGEQIDSLTQPQQHPPPPPPQQQQPHP